MIVFLDTETTGLDSLRHEPWEFGATVYDPQDLTYVETKHFFIRPKNLQWADPNALKISHFYERFYEAPRDIILEPEVAAVEIAVLTAGRIIGGFKPSFDMQFLDFLMRVNGAAPAWHYRELDVNAYACGVLGLDPVTTSTDDLLNAFPAELPDWRDQRHTALGDAELAADVFDLAFRMRDEEGSR